MMWGAGSRIGWAIVNNPAIARLMQAHIYMTSSIAQETQLRATHLLQHVLADGGKVDSSEMNSSLILSGTSLGFFGFSRPSSLTVPG